MERTCGKLWELKAPNFSNREEICAVKKDVECRKCYGCDVVIDESNDSSEHIINASLGGHRVARGILCKLCNNGSDFAKELDKETLKIAEIGLFFPIKYDSGRGKLSGKFWNEDGSPSNIFAGGNVRPAVHCEADFIDGKNTIRRLCYPRLGKSREDAVAFLRSEHSKLSEPKESLSTLERLLVEEPSSIRKCWIPVAIGGNQQMRAFGKIALNFCLYCKVDKGIVQEFIKYVKGTNFGPQNCYPYYFGEPIYVAKQDELSHLLVLKSNPKNGTLFCYIELFNSFKVLAILSEKYQGPQISFTYKIDVITGSETLDEGIRVLIGKNPYPYIAEDTIENRNRLKDANLRFQQCFNDLEQKRLYIEMKMNADSQSLDERVSRQAEIQR